MLKPVPIRLVNRITEIGGRADNGLPIFRIVRGSDRMTHIGGAWKDYDKSGNFLRETVEVRNVPKYPEALDRYIFEVLCPPENYGTERDWELQFTEWINGIRVETLGPFPRGGEYELVKVIETPVHHQFVPLTEAICDALVNTARLNRELPQRIRWEAVEEKRRRDEAAKEQRLIDRIEEMGIADFARHPHIIHPGFKEEKKSPGGIILPL